jgi:hypothetical protein
MNAPPDGPGVCEELAMARAFASLVKRVVSRRASRLGKSPEDAGQEVWRQLRDLSGTEAGMVGPDGFRRLFDAALRANDLEADWLDANGKPREIDAFSSCLTRRICYSSK